jgi:hypothetical protein
MAWYVELAFKPGALEDFRVLTDEMVEATRGEPRVLRYERFVSADSMVVHVHARYANSAAAVAHVLIDRCHGEGSQHRAMDVGHGDDLLPFLVPVARVANPIPPFLATVLVPSP